MISAPITLTDGQLATAAAAIFDPNTLFTNSSVGPLYVDVLLANTSSSLTQTIILTITRNGGTARRLKRFALAPNYQAQISSIAMSPGDTLLAVTTTASVVDYMVNQGVPGKLEFEVQDSNGATAQVNGTTITGATTLTSASATALAVGPNGATNPTLAVDGSTSSAAGGVKVTGAADAAGAAIAAIGSNTNEPLKIDGKGSGPVTIGSVSTGGTVVRAATATVAVGGTAIGNANAVGEGVTYVTGADDTAAVKLPASVAGKTCTVVNSVANKILIAFPPVSSQINAKGANNAFNIAASAVRTFRCYNTTLWLAEPETIA